MKLFNTILFFCLLFSSLSLHAQKDSSKKHDDYYGHKVRREILKSSVIDYAAGTFTLQYERAIAPDLSFQISGGFTLAQHKYAYHHHAKYKDEAIGGYLEGQLRYYPLVFKTAMKGIYVGAFSGLQYLHFSYKPYTPVNLTMNSNYIWRMRSGVMLGYQFIIKKRVVLDLYAGGGLKIIGTNFTTSYSNEFPLIVFGINNGMMARFGFSAGFVF